MKLKYMYKLLMVVLCVSFGVSAAGQQTPLFSNIKTNHYVYNPASALPDNAGIAFDGLSRIQWTNINGAPTTHLLNTRFTAKENKIGIGTTFLFDEVGPVNNVWADVSFSYRLQSKGDLSVDLGLSVGVQSYKLRLSGLRVNDADVLFIDNDVSNTIPNFGFGAKLNYKSFYLSLAAPRIARSRLISDEDISAGNTLDETHYYMGAGYSFSTGPDFTVSPSVYLRAVKDAPLSADIYIDMLFVNRFEFSPYFRVKEAFGANIRYYLKNNIYVGYAYEGNSKELRSVSPGGTHEFSFGIKQFLHDPEKPSKEKVPDEDENNQRLREIIKLKE